MRAMRLAITAGSRAGPTKVVWCEVMYLVRLRMLSATRKGQIGPKRRGGKCWRVQVITSKGGFRSDPMQTHCWSSSARP